MNRKRGAGVLLAPLFAVILTASLFTALALDQAQAGYTDVTEYASNPVYDPGSASYPCVLYDASRFSGRGDSYYYKMWYVDEGSTPFLKLACSNDGINWTNLGSPTGISANGYYATLQYFPSGYSATGGTCYYKIWYWDAGIMGNIGAIRTADSVDGVNWSNDQAATQDPAAPLVTGIAGDWNYHCYGPNDVLYNPSAANTGANPFDYTYAMYYSGASEGLVPGTEEIGLAYSADGAYWHAYGSNPVLQARTAGAWDGPGGGGNGYVLNASVIRESATMWHMWYSGGQNNWYSGIGYASSADGINWTKSAGNPILSLSDGVAWRNARTHASSVVFSPTHFDGHNPGGTNPAYKMWFAGRSNTASDDAIGYAYIALDQYTIAASADPAAGGTITGAGTYTQVDMVDLAAIPNPGWHFVNWTEGGVEVPGAGAAYSFKATADRTLVAHFAPDAYTWYLAEGATAEGFDTWILVQNPNNFDVPVDLTFMTENGPLSPPELQGVNVPANSRMTFDPEEFAQTYNLSTTVKAYGGDVVCERAMYDTGLAWGTDSIGTKTPSSVWYLAEGATDGGMETFIPVLNPNPEAVYVSLDFMTSSGQVAGPQDFRIPAGTRITFDAGEYVTDYDVSTVVTSEGGDVVCERSMYGGDRTWGHNSIGVAAPAATWYLAEGCTAPGFETWVLVQNPGADPVTVDLTLMTESGSQLPLALRDVVIPAHSRRSFNLAEYVQSYDLSTQVVAEGGGVICERAMYGEERTWGTDSIGATAPAYLWYLAEGCTGEGFETWVLVQNPGASPVAVDLTFMTSDGPQDGPQDVVIPAYSRRTFNVAEYVVDWNVSTRVLSVGGGVVCERAMYGNGRTWAHDSVGYAP